MAPSGYMSAARRDWSEEQAMRVLVLVRLRAKGYRGQSLRRIADMMPLSIMTYRFLVTDGRRVHLCLQEADAVAWMESVSGPVALESLPPLARAVRQAQPRPSGLTA